MQIYVYIEILLEIRNYMSRTEKELQAVLLKTVQFEVHGKLLKTFAGPV